MCRVGSRWTWFLLTVRCHYCTVLWMKTDYKGRLEKRERLFISGAHKWGDLGNILVWLTASCLMDR